MQTDTALDPELASYKALKHYVKLKNEIEELEDQIDAKKSEQKELEETAMRWFDFGENKTLNVMGRTAYIKRQVFAAKAESFDITHALDALKENGFEDCAKESIVWQTLSAKFREVEVDEIPEPLQKDFRLSEKFSIATRKA